METRHRRLSRCVYVLRHLTTYGTPPSECWIVLNVQEGSRRRVSTYYTFGCLFLSSRKLGGVKDGRRCATARLPARRLLQWPPAKFLLMKTLPDPRAYTPFSSNPLVTAAEDAAKVDSALQQEDAGKRLLRRLLEALETGNDARIEQALAEATSRPVRELLTHALGSALEARDEAALVMRVFAIPLLIVTGGRGLAVVPGVVPDVGELQKLFEKHGALGRSKNFGLGNALTTAEKLAAVK